MTESSKWFPASIIPKEYETIILRLNTGREIEGYFSYYNGPSYFEKGVGLGTKIEEWYKSKRQWVIEWRRI